MRRHDAALFARFLRTWEPSPRMPALVIIIDEYAGLAEQAPEAMGYGLPRAARPRGRRDARGRNPATDPEGHGPGRGSLADGRTALLPRPRPPRRRPSPGHAQRRLERPPPQRPRKVPHLHPEHDTPKRARAFLVTDQAVSQTVAYYAHRRPRLDHVSWDAMRAATHMPMPAPEISHDDMPYTDESDPRPDASPTPEDALWIALCAAPPQGWAIGAPAPPTNHHPERSSHRSSRLTPRARLHVTREHSR
jgi:S-DNA-T family DNA segregation ATPase FtsK/SpoIIIE